MAGNVTVRDMGWRKIKATVRDLDGKGVKVGIRARDAGKMNEGVAVVDIAIWNEFGTERIPSRPFMRRTADTSEAKFQKTARALALQMILGRLSADQALGSIGTWFVQAIQGTIRRSRSWAAPNAPSTIKAKGSSTPLIDHGVLLGTIDWEVDNKR